MAGILIKDMELPKDTGSITVTIYSDGSTGIWTEQEMIPGGMAIEIPKHGRLGDLDRVWKRLEDCKLITYDCRILLEDVFDTAPTVLEASECLNDSC